MASPFWTYFHDKLRWALIDAPGPVAAVIQGLAHRLDVVRDDVVFLRDQGFARRCEPGLVPVHGDARGIIRHHTETPEQFRQRVINAYAWHMMGGKQEGLPQILKFYGFNVGEVENLRQYQETRWAEFQLGLQNAALASELDAILEVLDVLVWLIDEYKPARSVLARLYNDVYDIHPTTYSDGPAYSDGLYSYFSGVPATVLGPEYDEELLLSFGIAQYGTIERAETKAPDFFGTLFFISEAPYIDGDVYSETYYGDDFPTNSGVFAADLTNLHACEALVKSYGWSGLWDSRRWQDTQSWGRISPLFTFSHTERSKVQAVYSDSDEGYGEYSDLNCVYGVPEYELCDAPAYYGDSEYSDDSGLRLVIVHEQFAETRLTALKRIPPEAPSLVCVEVCNAVAAPARNQTWSGAWDGRTWASHLTKAFLMEEYE